MKTNNRYTCLIALNTLPWLLTASRRQRMMCCMFLVLFYFGSAGLPAVAQKPAVNYQINVIAHPPAKSIRGLSVVTDRIIWASGTGGQVGKSTDGGAHWNWTVVPGCDSCDWRSLYAFDARKAIVLNAGAPAHIFLTEDGGTSWKRVYFDDRPGIFFDAIQFFNEQEGIAVGDPLGDKFAVIRTHNGGQSWEADAPGAAPAATPGESIFAASGTSMVTFAGKKVYFATGGSVARLFVSGNNWQAYTIPVVQGTPTTGVFSIAFLNSQKGIAVGGDYKQDTARKGNCMLTSDGGRTWYPPVSAPGGFRSGVTYISPKILIATGTSGTDISEDGGRHWKSVEGKFNVVARARKGTQVFLAGKDIAQLSSTR
ncbi:MAG: oxidoreductase [Chitinophaga sp.]|uniref:WD40/YVTN/BNR-like repeat-containing protein n=1 Tax=Chitinophaga sp. TaxID=1869181 RepID=UPI001B13D491|nr:YCF48-related protein [Chitinophaga sp.]MBO9730072.1 oxidoreductase [Chitinophaga sp.]